MKAVTIKTTIMIIFLSVFMILFSWYCSKEQPVGEGENLTGIPNSKAEPLKKLTGELPEGVEFLPFDTAPEPVGGFGAIAQNLRYPELARKAGIEGKVLVLTQIDEKGQIAELMIQQSLGENGCDEAAATAIRSVPWKPAMVGGKPIKTWVTIPVVFKLK